MGPKRAPRGQNKQLDLYLLLYLIVFTDIVATDHPPVISPTMKIKRKTHENYKLPIVKEDQHTVVHT